MNAEFLLPLRQRRLKLPLYEEDLSQSQQRQQDGLYTAQILIVLKSIISGSKCGLFERMLEPEPLGTPGAESYMRCLVSGGSGSLLCVSIDTIARLSELAGLERGRVVEVLNHLKYRGLVDVQSTGDVPLWEALDWTTWSVRTAGMDLVALHDAQAESNRRSEVFEREQLKKKAKIARVALSDRLKKKANNVLSWYRGKVGISSVLYPGERVPRIPGTDIVWRRELHGPGGSDVENHYIRKRQSKQGGRYYSYQIDPNTRLLRARYIRDDYKGLGLWLEMHGPGG